jgi:hypothetical protein
MAIGLAAAAWVAGACGRGEPEKPVPAVAEAASEPRVKETGPPRWVAGPPGIGYQPRACGFDLDDDGVVGEPADCRVCNGRDRDPDGDGIDEDQIYVDIEQGRDEGVCGAPDAPCATLRHALTQVAEGVADGAEDIVCLHGVAAESGLKPALAGLDGVVEGTARGSQGRAFERRRDPAMIVGWDRDGDGAYPPFDTDDRAEIVGHGKERAFLLDSRNDGMEIAHLVVRGFGMGTSAKDSGFVQFGPSAGELEHLHFHDLHLIDINRGRAASSETSTFDLFAGKALLRYLEVDNVWAPRNGGFFVRGAAADHGPDAGPYRFSHLSYTAEGCDFAECQQGATVTGFHLWGYVTGIEILDSHFDANVRAWEPKPKGGPTGAGLAIVAQCSQDWLIRNNLVVDFKVFVKAQGWADGYCDQSAARPVDKVRIEGNQVRNGYEPWTSGDLGVYVSEGGPNAGEVVGDLSITGNVIASSQGLEACFWLKGGNGARMPPGRVVIARNTCAVDINRHAFLVLGNAEGRQPAYPHRDVEVVDNVFTGLGERDVNVAVFHPLPTAQLDRNVWDPAGGFRWQGQPLGDLASWRRTTGHDAGSVACVPSLDDGSSGSFTARADDGCAAGRGARVAKP